MPPGGKMYRFSGHFGENGLPYGRHQCLPYSKDAVHADAFKQQFLVPWFYSDSISLSLYSSFMASMGVRVSTLRAFKAAQTRWEARSSMLT